MSENNTQLTDEQRFKKLLEYFVAQVNYLLYRKKHTITGEDRTLPESSDSHEYKWTQVLKDENGDFNTSIQLSGYDYNSQGEFDSTHKIIDEFREYLIDDQEQKICMSLQAGFQADNPKSNFLHWFSKDKSRGRININPIFNTEKSCISQLQIGLGIGVSYLLSDRPTYSISELGLFDDEDPNPLIYQMLKTYKLYRSYEMNGSFITGYCKSLLEKCYNLVLTGAPGTGKTYAVKEIAALMLGKNSWNEIEANEGLKERVGFVQFHPAYDYTDFVEGLRPIKKTSNDSQIGFERQNGVFKEFCKKAVNDWNPTYNEQTSGTEEDKIKTTLESVNKYVFIIDEINRGELSKIFGELFYSIDPGYRGIKGRVNTQYQNLVSKCIDTSSTDQCNYSNCDKIDPFYDGFFVPNNVYIIGTMNDIDRSVDSMDFAMRRRFTFYEVKAADRTDMWGTKPWADIAKNAMDELNKVIENIPGLSSAYHIGPSYFFDLDKHNGDFMELWKHHLKFLLFEYLRGRKDAAKTIDGAYLAYLDAIRKAINIRFKEGGVVFDMLFEKSRNNDVKIGEIDLNVSKNIKKDELIGQMKKFEVTKDQDKIILENRITNALNICSMILAK